jgi:hypothetical protein
VVGTVLLDNVLIALRRLAQEDVSARTFAGRRTSGAATGAAIAETSRSTG